MRMGRRVARFLFWGSVLCFSTLAGGLWFAYWYITDGETTARIIREHAVRYFPKAILEPGRVRPRLFAGELVLHDLKLKQAIDGALFETLRIAYLQIRLNPRKLAEGQLEPRTIVVGTPTLRLCCRQDGTWNLQGLIADPWPGPWIETPPIVIRNGTLELYPCEESGSTSEGAPEPSAGSLAKAATTKQSSDRATKGAASSASSPATIPPARTVRGASDGSPAILRDVSLEIEPVGQRVEGYLKFDGSARGDGFERLKLTGTIDLKSGRIEFGGELSGLLLSESLRRKIRPGARRVVQALGLNAGVVDLKVNRFQYDPTRPPGNRLHYNIGARLRDGVCDCPDLPFQVNDLSAILNLEDDRLTIKHAQGSNGMTILRADGVVAVDASKQGPLNMHVTLDDLELDGRLRVRTPPEYKELWDVFKPEGRVDVALDLVRARAGERVDWKAKVFCRDVGAVYREFPYPLDHLTGPMTFEKNTLTVDLKSLSGRPMTISGTIQNPGIDAVVKLDIEADSLPIDDALKKAMPADVRKIVNQFKPSGLVKAHARVSRRPTADRVARPEGLVHIDADIELSERCEITWEGLPYPVRDLTGRLEIHPDKWTFKNVRGRNGEATITASGSVENLHFPKLANGEDPLKIDVDLHADNLPFSGELQLALPKAWRKTWPTINPSGACDVDAQVHISPVSPERTEIIITPRAETNLRLLITRSPQPGIDPGGTFDLPMEDVRGRFVFYNGVVTMNDVNFKFRGGAVRFSTGTAILEDTGRFDLNVHELWVENIRFDLDLRKKMPPLMSQFALRLDDGSNFRARGDLQIGWSGSERDLAWCKWKNTKVVFLDNTVKTAIPLEHMQGELNNVSGWSNGITLEVDGILKLESIYFLGQQITQLESPFHVKRGQATLDSVQGHFLGGKLFGEEPCWVSLDATPRYHAVLSLAGAQLEEYARTISGRQSYRGKIDAKIDISGLGSDVRNLHGRGEAHISQGDLGKLPPVLRLASALNSPLPNINAAPESRTRAQSQTAFDSADVTYTIQNGLTTFERIKFTGNAFSLLGKGTLDPQGHLDLRLSVLWGRDRFHIPLVSDVARRASTSFIIAYVNGTPSNPQFDLVPFPQVGDALRALNRTRSETQPQ